MNLFHELVDRSFSFSMSRLDEINKVIFELLDQRSDSHLVRSLQMVSLQQVIMAVGIFSIFEAYLQGTLGCRDGFSEVGRRLKSKGENSLYERFLQFKFAINVLKHGRGESYDRLLVQIENLPFRMKRPGENFFEEGDVGEVDTLIYVDRGFIELMLDTMKDISSKVEDNQWLDKSE